MNKHASVILFISLVFSSSLHAEWDRDDNLREAARQWSNIYCSSGIQGMEDYVRGCFGSIQYIKGVFPQKLERCLALDFISSTVDAVFSKALKAQASAYFASDEVRKRSRDALTKVDVPESQQEMVVKFIGGEAFKHLTPCPEIEGKPQDNADYTEIKSALLDANSAIGKTISILGSFRSFGIFDDAPHMIVKANTDTDLNIWRVKFSSTQRQLVQDLDVGQEVSIVCRIIEISTFPECALIAMR